MPWWDPRDVPHGQELELRLGRLALRVAREGELARLAWRHVDATEEPSEVRFDEPGPVQKPEAGWEVHRYATSGTDGQLSLRPRLAPKPMVARPEVPFSVAPGASVEVYVGTPMWTEVTVGGDALAELAAIPPKHTWFGTPTEGEACFGMYTHLRMDLGSVAFRPHRAVAPVTIRNRGTDALEVDRLWIPVHHLALSVDDQGRLWTQPLELIRDQGQEHAERKISDSLRGERLSAPREAPSANPVMRVFNSVFR